MVFVSLFYLRYFFNKWDLNQSTSFRMTLYKEKKLFFQLFYDKLK